jgi:fructuronate reductase
MKLSSAGWRSYTSSNALPPPVSTQDYLYTLAILDKTIHYQIIGAIKEVLVAGEQSDAIFARLLAATTGIISLTITEKGYCLKADDSMDMAHPDIAADLSNPRKPQTAVDFLVEGLRLRHASGVAAFNVLSCDNASGNGDKLRKATLDYALKIDQTLASWIADSVAFPNSMVDSITSKTAEFTQWVISEAWTGDRPDWEGVGVIFTNDVEGFEKAKLRLLNCLHSTLAYSGSLAGFETVYEVSSDAGFHRFISALASTEIIGSFDAPEAMDIEKYSRDVIARFLNPEIHHLLSQIACDGPHKIQMRLLPIIRDNLRLQRPTQYLCLSLASCFQFICRALDAGREIVDSMADTFSQLPALRDSDPGTVVKSFLSIRSIFSADLIDHPLIIQQLTSSLLALRTCAGNGQSIKDALNRGIYDD